MIPIIAELAVVTGLCWAIYTLSDMPVSIMNHIKDIKKPRRAGTRSGDNKNIQYNKYITYREEL